jgi:hypothetical protein
MPRLAPVIKTVLFAMSILFSVSKFVLLSLLRRWDYGRFTHHLSILETKATTLLQCGTADIE